MVLLKKIVFTALESIHNAQTLLSNLNLDLDDDVFIVEFDKLDRSTCQIWEIYKISPAEPLIINNVGTWSKNDGLNMTSLQKYERRRNLMVTAYNMKPHIY